MRALIFVITLHCTLHAGHFLPKVTFLKEFKIRVKYGVQNEAQNANKRSIFRLLYLSGRLGLKTTCKIINFRIFLYGCIRKQSLCGILYLVLIKVLKNKNFKEIYINFTETFEILFFIHDSGSL